MNPPLPCHTTIKDCALFLDIDGTLLDFSLSPENVIVPAELPATLHALFHYLSGALAFISGRHMADIERLFGPSIAIGAEHGALLRTADGTVIFETAPAPVLPQIMQALRKAIAPYPGVLLEEKHYGATLHWRADPAAAQDIKSLACKLTAPYPDLALLPAHEALEIRTKGVDKAIALEKFMALPPFAGRIPVFIGDDVTDEAAIAKASAMGGLGLHVGRDFGGSPQAVRNWLAERIADVTSA